MQKTVVSVDFARGKWNPAEWTVFKSLRFDYAHAFVQMDDHIPVLGLLLQVWPLPQLPQAQVGVHEG